MLPDMLAVPETFPDPLTLSPEFTVEFCMVRLATPTEPVLVLIVAPLLSVSEARVTPPSPIVKEVPLSDSDEFEPAPREKTVTLVSIFTVPPFDRVTTNWLPLGTQGLGMRKSGPVHSH